jgi:hypothetical protein
MIERIISGHHDPIFAAHPGQARTYELISLNYWWPQMRASIDDYVIKCDQFQKRKGAHEFKAPLGNVPEPSEIFQVTSMDITGP